MKTTHTLGPWKYGKFNNYEYFDIDSSTTGERICSVYCGIDAPEEEQQQAEANARLIAAAPELLEALELCLNRLNIWAESDAWDMDDEAAYTAAKAAINKATNNH